MSLSSKLRHWFTPHHTNNFRARLLHNSGIFAVLALILAGNLFLRLLDSTNLHILGFTSSVTIDEVVRATNEERVAQGLSTLSYNEKLADAARRKAANMFAENYWAHDSPGGKSPWVWFKEAGYSYVYAGENLAKDFGDTSRMMSAWMASPTHKKNIINPQYTEIGLAVVPGTLQGQETVLVVQLFGTSQGGFVPQVASAATATVAEIKEPVPSPTQPLHIESESSREMPPDAKQSGRPRYNQFNLARALNLGTTALFILALVLDLLIAESRVLTRRVGNNWAHIIFINFILLATTIVNAGKIL
ncbi:MAG: CAP domain-containing protein [bacterium]